jgi:NAD(P)-dependent dehydrogenase (short-subunit alcohol dehydrogenase family)
MDIRGCVALVTGANRGLGRAFTEALVEAGAAKVYAGARNPTEIINPRLDPIRLDVADADTISAAAERCDDTMLVINNAGVMLSTPMLAPDAADAMRREMAVNVFGLQAMIAGFAPVLARQGGGGIINMLSVVSWFTTPFNATYCASKQAALAVSDAARIQLAEQGTQVTGVYAGFIDTDMAAGIAGPKTSPRQIADRAIAGLVAREDHVLADERARQVRHDTRHDPDSFAANLRLSWEQRAR